MQLHTSLPCVACVACVGGTMQYTLLRAHIIVLDGTGVGRNHVAGTKKLVLQPDKGRQHGDTCTCT